MSTISTNAIQSVGTTLQLGTQNNTKAQVDSSGNFSSVIPGGSTLLPEFRCRAWVNFDGTTGAIRASGNVSSVTRNATGVYTLNFTTAMPDANYAVSGGGRSTLATDRGAFFSGIQGTAQTPSAYSTTQATLTFTGNNQAGNGIGAADPTIATIALHR
jgi:hypothetical protein